MRGERIDFTSVDAARFNHLRDRWRSAASSSALPKAALRVATVLPGFVSREYGYAFPTDRDIAGEITADEKTAKRGLAALESKGLIERVTKSKRNERGIVIGRTRRIYLADDLDFLDAFDRFAVEMTTGHVRAGELEMIAQQAFDKATDSSDLFMPVHWKEICDLRNSDTAEWFIQRTGTLIHRKAA